MNCFGRYFDTNLAILPVIVITIIRSILRDKAALTQEAAISSAVSDGGGEAFVISS